MLQPILPPPSRGGLAPYTIFPVRPRIAFAGDSRIANGVSLSGTTAFTPIGMEYWVTALTQARVECRPEWNFGVSGDTSEALLARLDSVLSTCLAGDVGIFCILTTINDRQSENDWTVARTLTALKEIQRRVLATGMVIIWLQEFPAGSSSFTSARLSTAQNRRHHQIIEWIAQQAFMPRNFVADARPYLCDPSSTVGDYADSQTYDGVHENQSGAYRASARIAEIIDTIIPPVSLIVGSNSGGYNVTDNPTGNLLTNGQMLGTGGTTSAGGSTISGNFADSWTGQGQNATDLTITGSKETVGGFEWQQLVVSGTPSVGGPTALMTGAVTVGNLTAGDILEGLAAFELDAGHSGVASLVARFTLTYDTSSSLSAGWGTTPPYVMSMSTALSGIARTPRLVIPSGTLNSLQFRIGANLLQGAAASFTMRWRAARVKKIVAL